MKRQPMSTLALAMLLVLPMLAIANGANAAPSQPEAGWVNLWSEDFEGEFPRGLWRYWDPEKPYQWGQRSCNPHSGRYSMWGGGGGTLGAQISCSDKYVTNVIPIVVYGPFDLTGCTDARLNFAHWTWLGAGDSLGIGIKTHTNAWYILNTYGDWVSTCDGWCEESFNQSRWSTPLCGEPEVYVLFRFVSNAEGVSYGTFVDDVSLDAYYEGTPPPRSTPTTTPTPTATATSTASMTPTATPTALSCIYLPLLLR